MFRVMCWAALMGFGLPAVAADFEPWGTSGDWQILVDPETGNGCLMQRTLDSGHVVEIGSDPIRQGGFFAVMFAEWTHLEEGQEGSLIFDFGDAKFGGDATGVVRGGLPGGLAFFDNPDFVTEFGKRNVVKVTGSGGKTVEISLQGTQKALAAVRACQEEQPEQ